MDISGSFANWCAGPGLWQAGAHGMGGWLPFHVGGLFQLLIIGAIIYFTVRLLRKPATSGGAATPEGVLKRWYAAGEIDAETYKRMKQNLQNGP